MSDEVSNWIERNVILGIERHEAKNGDWDFKKAGKGVLVQISRSNIDELYAAMRDEDEAKIELSYQNVVISTAWLALNLIANRHTPEKICEWSADKLEKLVDRWDDLDEMRQRSEVRAVLEALRRSESKGS